MEDDGVPAAASAGTPAWTSRALLRIVAPAEMLVLHAPGLPMIGPPRLGPPPEPAPAPGPIDGDDRHWADQGL